MRTCFSLSMSRKERWVVSDGRLRDGNADSFCWGSRDSLQPFFLRFRNLITETSHRSWICFILLDS